MLFRGRRSQAASSTTAIRTQDCALRTYITPPLEVRQLDWHGTRTRAVASGLCVAGFRRVCLCRAPSGREAIIPNYHCPITTGAAGGGGTVLRDGAGPARPPGPPTFDCPYGPGQVS